MKKFLFLALMIIATGEVRANRATLPYEFVSGKMIVQVIIQGQRVPLVFDTGGQTTVTAALASRLALEKTTPLSVIDVNSVSAEYQRVILTGLSFEDSALRLNGFPAIVLDESVNPFAPLGAHGMIGSDLLQHFVVTIDHSQHTILLDTELPAAVNLRAMSKFIPVAGNMPVIPLTLSDGRTIAGLIDTGYAGLLNLSEDDYEQLNQRGSVETISEGFGGKSIGLAGVSAPKVIRKVVLERLNAGTVRFNRLQTETAGVPYTLLGTEALQYGKMMIDYPRNRLFFEPHTKEPVEVTVLPSWNVGFSIESGKLTVATLWDEMREKLNLDDVVTAIDGEQLGELDFDTVQRSGGIEQLKGKTDAVISVLHHGQIITVKIEKR